MKRSLLILFGIVIAIVSFSQTKTTNALQEKYDDSFVLFFYNSTLRMINQQDDKEFDELIKDIEKMKFLMIDKIAKGFTKKDYTNLVKSYQSEKYENLMTAHSNGRNFDVYLREDNDNVKGTVILVNDSSDLYVLDILGKVQPNQVTKFFSTLDESSDIAKRLKDFTGRSEADKKRLNKGEIKVD